jgi:predicted TIM-barrel fold metal-dependent hydrolase
VIDSGTRRRRPQPFIARIAENFGAERMMWGSDFSQTHDRSYAELAALGQRASEGLSAGDRAAYLGGTAARLWGLPA